MQHAKSILACYAWIVAHYPWFPRQQCFMLPIAPANKLAHGPRYAGRARAEEGHGPGSSPGFLQQSKHIGASEAVNKSEQQAARLDQHADTCTVPHLPHILFHDAVGSTSFSAGETSSQAPRAHRCLHLIDERLYNENVRLRQQLRDR